MGLKRKKTTTFCRGFLHGAGEGNRTLVASLGSWGSAIKLRLHMPESPATDLIDFYYNMVVWKKQANLA